MKRREVIIEEGICELGKYVLSYDSDLSYRHECGRCTFYRTYTLDIEGGDVPTKLVFVKGETKHCDKNCRHPDEYSKNCNRKTVRIFQETKGWIGLIIDSSIKGPHALSSFEDFLSLYGISPPTTGDIMPHMESSLELTPKNAPAELTVDDEIELARQEEEIRDALSSIESLHFEAYPYVQTFYDILKKHYVDVD